MNPTENILIDLPVGVKNYPDYVASDYDPNSTAAKNILAAGFPPDIVHRDAVSGKVSSLWGSYYNDFWEVTACQWQQRFDPTYDTYGAGVGNYDFLSRLGLPGVSDSISAVTTTGRLTGPMRRLTGRGSLRWSAAARRRTG